MKLLILDGIPANHPYADYSDTIVEQLMVQHKLEVDYFRLRDMNMNYCTGCWSCWTKTPGLCSIKDDHEAILSRLPHADHVLYLSPVIFGYESALLKTCKDRGIPIAHPYIQIYNGEQHHVKRYPQDPYKIHVLMLTDEDTTDEDLSLIRHTYDRVALNFHSEVKTFHTYQGKGGFDYVLNHI